MPLVSVVMPVYNGEAYLAEAIDSILAQTLRDFELLIIDDGSTDRSSEIIDSYGQLDSRIRHIRLEENMGQAFARDQGYNAAKGALITHMDCDDICLPQRLQKQVEFMRTNPAIGALGTCGLVKNSDLSQTYFDYLVPEQHALIALNLFFGASFLGASVMIRRDLIVYVGRFDNASRINPDLELSMSLLWASSFKFANLPEKLYIYRRHDRALTTVQRAAVSANVRKLRGQALQRLWQGVPDETLDRFQALRRQEKLSWRERRAARKDLYRLVESLIAHILVSAEDRDSMLDAVNLRLEQASPRLWQQFCHWRRHRFPRLFPDPRVEA